MITYPTSVSPNNFILGDDGVYVATILASTHGLGSSVYITKSVHRNDDLSTENVLFSYKVEANGDIRIYSDEPTLIRFTIVAD